MPTVTGYTKIISVDFPNNKINISSLRKEIRNSNILIALDYIQVESDECKIWFKDILDTADIMELARVVAEHDGESIPDDTKIKIEEESTPTGGNYAAMSIKLTAPENGTDILDLSWPFPISALNMKYPTTIEHKNDGISLCIAPDTIIGGLTQDITGPPIDWVLKNYIIGDIVLYTGKAYTCIRDTITNEDPTNTLYWRRGYPISVSSTVVEHTMLGYYIKIDDLTNNNDLGRVIYKTISKIYVENYPTSSFLAAGPTYVRQTVYIFNNVIFGRDWNYSFGENKIGGSYVPANTIVRLKYFNNNSPVGELYGILEYLY